MSEEAMPDDWLRPDWPAPPGVVAASTTRTGGVSEGSFATLNLGAHVGDEPAAVAGNRRRLREALGLAAEPRWLEQVHGTTVVDAAGVGDDPPAADASFTTQPGVACAVLTADCLPVLFSTIDGTAVAAAHAGWRGLAAGVLECTIAAMPAPPDRLLAWLGPAISQPAFEVGSEVRDAFLAADEGAGTAFESNERGRYQADLYRLARRRLQRAGVAGVYGGGWCTHADAGRFFSYRRDGQCGRMATVIAIRTSPVP